jgi:hypothetical protein
MGKKLDTLSPRTGLLLLVAGTLLSAVTVGHAQGSTVFQPAKKGTGRERGLPDRLPDKPSIPPVFSIPVEPLGFSAPGAIYLGQRNVLASLDFIDEDHLLFTFRVPGLLHREAKNSSWSDERRIRAVVLALPNGTISAEALWTVHDRIRYLWMLKDGHFLLRDRDGIQQGDASLQLKPSLRFPGPLQWMEMDPSQDLLVTNSDEPVETAAKPGEVSKPADAEAGMTVDGQKAGVPNLVVRILERDSAKVMLVSRTRSLVHLPINSDGYVEGLRGDGEQWLLNLNYFSGGSRVLGRVSSTCSPSIDFVSQRELLATGCEATGAHRLVALNTDGRKLWEGLSSAQTIWPLLVMAPNGSRLARETLVVNHEINAYSPLDAEDIKGQLVQVFNAADGAVALETTASPSLDAGGNVAISPSGRRVAVVNAGAIQVFQLPEPPEVPSDPKAAVKH